MRHFYNLHSWTPVRAASSIFAILAICIIAGCGGGQSEVENFTRKTGIRFPANARLEKYVGRDPGRDGPTVYFKMVTDGVGFKKTIATLPKASKDWKKDQFDGNDWFRLSSKDRLGISNHYAGIELDHEQPPAWWRPDSIGDFVASEGHILSRYWTFIGGKDTSGRYVIYAFYFQTCNS